MKCQICKDNIATIHLTEIEDGETKEVHLCESCYQNEKKNVFIEPAQSVNELISDLAASIDQAGLRNEGTRCPVCSASYADFQKKGLFGCPNDYTVFRDSVYPLLEKIHGSSEHKGKIPKSAIHRQSSPEQLIVLRRELDEAISNERYEKAAELRDEITKLEH
jgi:protein arginine kinase activator